MLRVLQRGHVSSFATWLRQLLLQGLASQTIATTASTHHWELAAAPDRSLSHRKDCAAIKNHSKRRCGESLPMIQLLFEDVVGCCRGSRTTAQCRPPQVTENARRLKMKLQKFFESLWVFYKPIEKKTGDFQNIWENRVLHLSRIHI